MLDWIVCKGAERSVTDRRVACPASFLLEGPRTIPLAECLACRHLVASGVDRLPVAMCASEPRSSWQEPPAPA
jgi:hypothetical protein